MWEFWAAVVLAVSGAVVTYWAVQRTPKLADLSERRRMRVQLAHKYWQVDYDIVRGTLTDDIPGIVESAARAYHPPDLG